MNQNHSGMYKNNLSSHAALLLSASPTIVTSPLNNPQQSSSNVSNPNINLNRSNHPASNNEIAKRLAMNRRISTTPLVSNPNLDQINQAPVVGPSMMHSTMSNGSYINFKKPQNEIFKKLDGKIQKIVAAHSNLNKLYALNDFAGVTNGPKRPFELPPQLPPPPPCVPKTTSPIEPGRSLDIDYSMVNQTRSNSNSSRASSISGNMNLNVGMPGQSMRPGANQTAHNDLNDDAGRLSNPQSPSSFNLDNAISRLHQRRQGNAQSLMLNTQKAHQRRPNVGHPGPIKQVHPVYSSRNNIHPVIGQSNVKPQPIPAGPPKPNKVDPAIMRLMAQKIRDAIDNDRGPKSHQQSSSASTIAEKKKFQVDLINLLKREISVVAKSANINFTTPPKQSQPPKQTDQKPLLRTSPQSLFNTIHRETSLLLQQRDNIRSTLSIIASPQKRVAQFRPQDKNSSPLQQQQQQRQLLQLKQQQLQQQIQQQQMQKIPTTIKLVLPPTEFIPDDTNKTDNSVSPRKASSLKPSPSYQFIKNKLRQFQLRNHISLSKAPLNSSINSSSTRKKPGHQKTLDNIVDRLQAKSSLQPSISLAGNLDAPVGQSQQDSRSLSFQQRIVNTSAQLIRNSRMNNTTTLANTPIPVFRIPYGNVTKGVYYNKSNALKSLSVRSKKNKKLNNFGLMLSSYLERGLEEPTQDKITIDDYARALDLVRPNDISLQRHKEKLLQSESRWKPSTNRPVRLRRLRGEKIHMPASASYRAASKAGLQ